MMADLRCWMHMRLQKRNASGASARTLTCSNQRLGRGTVTGTELGLLLELKSAFPYHLKRLQTDRTSGWIIRQGRTVCTEISFCQ